MALSLDQGRSVAMWGRLTESQDNAVTCSLHFNYWRTKTRLGFRKKRKLHKDFLDIGLLVDNPQSKLEALSLYLPLAVDRNAISDLGRLFRASSIATGIFNERLQVRHRSGDPIIRIERPGQGRAFNVYRFSSSGATPDERDLRVDDVCGGTLLTITARTIQAAERELEENESLYFRLRVELPKDAENVFVNRILPSDRWLLSGFDTIEYVDFRVNEARNLPEKIEDMKGDDEMKGGILPIKRVDFLLVSGVGADLVGGHKVHKSRLLESELWEPYVGNGKKLELSSDMVIYHWRKERDEIEDFNAFAKFRFRHSNAPIVLSYLLLGLIVSVLTGIAGNMLWSMGMTQASKESTKIQQEMDETKRTAGRRGKPYSLPRPPLSIAPEEGR